MHVNYYIIINARLLLLLVGLLMTMYENMSQMTIEIDIKYSYGPFIS